MPESIVEVDHVSLIYHEISGETHAIEDLSFDVKEREFVSIVGPSGCGKTSILSLLAGLMPPSSGTIRISGKICPDICFSTTTCWIGAPSRGTCCWACR